MSALVFIPTPFGFPQGVQLDSFWKTTGSDCGDYGETVIAVMTQVGIWFASGQH
jgi:hypothetical protein